jgi:hypothetical protein
MAIEVSGKTITPYQISISEDGKFPFVTSSLEMTHFQLKKADPKLEKIMQKQEGAQHASNINSDSSLSKLEKLHLLNSLTDQLTGGAE